MKTLCIVTGFIAAACIFTQAAAGDIQLPQPRKTGGTPLFEAIDQRSSAIPADFPSGKIDNETLATILWAATGHNRDGQRWTVPMAMGLPPYCKIYATSSEGVYLYDWERHALRLVTSDNLHGSIPMQQFAKESPMNLYIVSDGTKLAAMDNPFGEEFGMVLAGAMSQNIYLACQGVGVGARLVYSIQREKAEEALQLGSKDKVYFAMILGKK